ncbi:MAG: cupin domain-containing protein [Pigmentiphaga sp.]
MAIPSAPHTPLQQHVGRYLDKRFDWQAFPRSEGHPLLARGQMRFIGAGGSPKVDDPNTLPPNHFTLSIIDLPVDHYGASHYHDDCEEVFLMLDGRVTIGMTWDDVVLETCLGPKDLMLLPIGRPHGYRNDSQDPVRLSIMVGHSRPKMPVYVAHPTQSEHGPRFGAAPGKTEVYSPASDDPRHQAFGRYLCRYAEQPLAWHPAGFAAKVYVGPGGLEGSRFREDLIMAPRGVGVQPYAREVEDAYFVLEGVLTVGWEVDGKFVETRIGPKDVVLNPAGRVHYFRNEGFEDVQFMLAAGNDSFELATLKAR